MLTLDCSGENDRNTELVKYFNVWLVTFYKHPVEKTLLSTVFFSLVRFLAKQG